MSSDRSLVHPHVGQCCPHLRPASDVALHTASLLAHPHRGCHRQRVAGKRTTIAAVRCAGSKLAPEDSQQLVQQGGSLLLRGDKILFTNKDSGILMTTDVDALLPALKAAAAVPLKA